MALVFVLVAFVANDVPSIWLWRPLAVSALVALSIEAILVKTMGAARGSVWAFIGFTALAGMFLVAGATMLALTLFSIIRSRPGVEYQLVGVLAGLLSTLMLSLLLVVGLTRGAFDWQPPVVTPIDLGSADPGPSIHMLLLDGYPRADVLAKVGFDNREFLDALRERGFDVYDNSLSNYDLTPFSLLSMLSLQHIDAIESVQLTAVSETAAEQARRMTRALLDPPIFDALEEIGYATRLLTADVVSVTIGGADVTWNAGTANNFELDALQRTPLAGLLEVFGFAIGQHRSDVERTVAMWADAPATPTFTFAHVVSPHSPFFYGVGGVAAASPPCYPASCQLYHQEPEGSGWPTDEFWRRMGDHLRVLNRLVLDRVDELVASDPGGVVVLLSDHGMSGEDELDRFRNLIIARTPGHPELLGDAPTPINVLPRVLNAYLGSDLPIRPDTLYRHGDGASWLSVEQVQGEQAQSWSKRTLR
jgi:hypothetical protein